MEDWRARSWFQIGQLEQVLGGAEDAEVCRRKDAWVAIDRFSWPQYKEPQFGQLELATRTEVELFRYLLQVPPARDLLMRAPAAAPAPAAASQAHVPAYGDVEEEELAFDAYDSGDPDAGVAPAAQAPAAPGWGAQPQ